MNFAVVWFLIFVVANDEPVAEAVHSGMFFDSRESCTAAGNVIKHKVEQRLNQVPKCVEGTIMMPK